MTQFDNVDKNLTLLAEEAAEVIQQVCKIKRFGLYDQDNDVRLEKEVGGLLACIYLLKKDGTLSEEALSNYMRDKLKRLEKWYE